MTWYDTNTALQVAVMLHCSDRIVTSNWQKNHTGYLPRMWLAALRYWVLFFGGALALLAAKLQFVTRTDSLQVHSLVRSPESGKVYEAIGWLRPTIFAYERQEKDMKREDYNSQVTIRSQVLGLLCYLPDWRSKIQQMAKWVLWLLASDNRYSMSGADCLLVGSALSLSTAFCAQASYFNVHSQCEKQDKQDFCTRVAIRWTADFHPWGQTRSSILEW